MQLTGVNICDTITEEIYTNIFSTQIGKLQQTKGHSPTLWNNEFCWGFLKEYGWRVTERSRKDSETAPPSPPPSMGNSSLKLETEAHCLQEAQQVGEFDLFQAARAVWAYCVVPRELGGNPVFSPVSACVCLPALLKVIFFLFRVSHIEMFPSLFCLHIFSPESLLLLLIKELRDHTRPLCIRNNLASLQCPQDNHHSKVLFAV